MDLKGLGYLISTVSVFVLGLAAWPGPGDPEWHGPAVIVGMVLSVMGMAVRYTSHQQDRKDIRRAAFNQPPKS